MFKLIKNSEKSFALILALFILLAFSMTGITLATIASKRTDAYINQINSLKSYYLTLAGKNYFLEYALPFDVDLNSANNTNFSKTLGGTNNTFSIVYNNPTARSADVLVYGRSSTFEHYVKIALAENSSIPGLLRKYALISYDTVETRMNNPCNYVCSPNCFCWLYYDRRHIFGNAYFNGNLALGSGNPGADSSATWGVSGYPRNLYVRGNADFTKMANTNAAIPPPLPTSGVFGVLYRTGTVTDPNNALHSIPSVLCPAVDPECNNWPTTKPTINLNYFDNLLTAAASSTIPSPLTINTTHDFRLLNYRNIYVNGNVVIATSSALPLTGPGNIIATGTITVNTDAYIGEKVGLIAAGNITINTTARVGGTYNATYDTIDGFGDFIYSRTDLSVLGTARVKAFAMLTDNNPANTPTTAAVNFANYPAADHATFQGLIYTEQLTSSGVIYGSVLTETLPGTVAPHKLPLGVFYDKLPWPSGTLVWDFWLPLEVRGLYRLQKTETFDLNN